MTLQETLIACGMTPPPYIAPGRFIRFPGCGKKRGNTAGWCRLITPTFAIYGDWSTGLTETWRSDEHVDTAESQRLLREARQRESQYRIDLARKHARVSAEARHIVASAKVKYHAYLVRKGFPEQKGLVAGTQLVVPMRDVADYENHLLSVQLISESGEKLFLTGGRAMGAVHRLGASPARATRTVLCEGYATGLSLIAALERLRSHPMVVVCFSAKNLEAVAPYFPGAIVAADNDHPNLKRNGEKAGELAAIATGLNWIMPAQVGFDFNDLAQKEGIYAVVNMLREAFQAQETVSA